MKFTRIEDIDALVSEGQGKVAVVVLHGYGASCQDLAPFGDVIDRQKEMNWYFLDGVLPVDIGYGMQGRAWFPIDMMGMQQAMLTGHFQDFFKNEPPGLKDAYLKIKKVLENLSLKYEEVYLGGFSQGSMMSMQLAFNHPELIKKLFILSGTFVNEKEWMGCLENGFDLPVFQSHGNQDPVLPIIEGRRLHESLKRSCPKYEFHEFNGGHEIPMDIVGNLKRFLMDK